MEPSPADYIFVLPKLMWPKPPGKARWKTRVKNINERMALAQQGKWKTLLELSMKLPLPTYEPTPEEELLDEHGLSQEMARKLHAAACQGQVGKAWKQMRSPPPSKITKEVWEEAKGKLKTHHDAPPLSVDAKSWHPTVEQCTTVIYELKHNKAPDVGGWTTESAKAVFYYRISQHSGLHGSPELLTFTRTHARQGPGMLTNWSVLENRRWAQAHTD